MKSDDYLKSPRGRLHRHTWRKFQQVVLSIEEIEPRGKATTPKQDQLSIQKQVLSQLQTLKRKAFRGPIALSIRIGTTDKNPAHAHTITKNLLDLLGKPLPEVSKSRGGLLYVDDTQVHALSVSCNHGRDKPRIWIRAIGFRYFLQDLDLTMHVLDTLDHEMNHWDVSADEDDYDAIDHLREILRNEAYYRKIGGHDTFQSILRAARYQAQKYLLKRSRFGPRELGCLYRVSGLGNNSLKAVVDNMYTDWENVIRASPMRITLTELPYQKGASAEYKRQVQAALRTFRDHYKWILDPLVVPIGLEVAIKPSAPSKVQALHDLDNVLRNYLIPRVVEELRPPSSIAWTVDPESLKRHNPELLAPWTNQLRQFPASARVGLTKFEAWRLPRPNKDLSPGFVSVAIVADPSGLDTTIHRMDRIMEKFRSRKD